MDHQDQSTPQMLERDILDHFADLYTIHNEELQGKLTPEARKAATVVCEAISIAQAHIARTFKGSAYRLGAYEGVDVIESDENVVTLSVQQATQILGKSIINAGPNDLLHICSLNGLVSAHILRAGKDESARQIFCQPHI